MKHRLHVEPQAEREVEEASDWYEAQQEGIGTSFVAAFRVALEKIAHAPTTFAPVPGVDLDSPVRSASMKPYPYRVIFVEEKQRLRVIAVMHGRRDPGYWRDRLRK